jgi:hypothetical protein
MMKPWVALGTMRCGGALRRINDMKDPASPKDEEVFAWGMVNSLATT